MENYINLFENIIEKIMPKVDYVDIRAGPRDSTALIMKDGDLQEINTGMSSVARIRVLNNGAWGFASTNDFAKLEEIAQTAIQMSNKLVGDVELAENDIIKDKIKTDVKIPFNDVSVEEKKELMNDANQAASLDEINSITISYSDSKTDTIFINNEGTLIEEETSCIGLFMNAAASNGEIIQFGHDSLGGVKGYEILQNADIEEFGRNVALKAKRLLTASTAPSGKYPIIADGHLTGVFVHEALGHAVEGDLILQNDSILKGKLGEQIGSDIVNICDNPTLRDGFGYYEYDVEGVKTFKNQLVKDGKLVSLLNSRESASKLGMRSSGNARSVISEQPIVRMSNTYMEPGDMSFDELIEDIADGIYLLGSRGGQVDTGKGIFQFNAAEGYLIKNGEITDNLRDVSLSGNILETMQNVDGLGKEIEYSVGFCGKGGQTVPVGDGGPHTRILNAMVGGSN